MRGKQTEAAQQRGIKEGHAQETEASGEMDEKRKRRRWMEAKVDVQTDREAHEAECSTHFKAVSVFML